MIPKTIHYCWFGGNPLGPEETRCIESWKRNCLGYEIVRWDESNYDVTKNPYMHEAYEAGKWAFVADYARIDVVNAHGGLYFDTDVEVLRPFDEFLNCSMFAGWESRDPLLDKLGIPYENSVAFGLGYGAECDHPVLQDLLDFYDELSFYNEDGSMNLVACPHYQTESLKKFGLNDSARTRQSLPGGIEIYPEDYFSPKSQLTGEIELTEHPPFRDELVGRGIQAREPAEVEALQAYGVQECFRARSCCLSSRTWRLESSEDSGWRLCPT